MAKRIISYDQLVKRGKITKAEYDQEYYEEY